MRLGIIFRSFRGRYSTNFADFVSPSPELQYSYARGVLFVGYILLLFFIVWTLTIIVLKLKGSEVGCASGAAFQRSTADSRSHVISTDSSSEDYEESLAECDQSMVDSEIPMMDKFPLDDADDEVSDQISNGSKSFADDYTSHEGWLASKSDLSKHETSKRERRTRLAFIGSCLISLLCVPVILVFSFAPMKEGAHSSDEVVAVSPIRTVWFS